MTAEIFIQRFPPFGFVVIGGIFDEKACVGKVGWHCYANSVILIVKQILNNKKIKCSFLRKNFLSFQNDESLAMLTIFQRKKKAS